MALRLSRPGRLVASAVCVAVAGGSCLAMWRLSDYAGALASARGRPQSRSVVAQSLLGHSATQAPMAAPATEAFAQVRGLALHVPVRQAVGIAYHEAAKARALRLTPRGWCVKNENRTRFKRPAPTAGPRYVVMSSRGRGHPATSAVDVAMAPGEEVLSPVTGTVSRVKRYRLYGVYRDFRLSLKPAGHDDVRAIVLHVTDLRVKPGTVLVAGATVLGTVRSFSFRSQVNDYFGRGVPHVHLEVQRIGS